MYNMSNGGGVCIAGRGDPSMTYDSIYNFTSVLSVRPSLR